MQKNSELEVRYYKEEDINDIILLAKNLHLNYSFSLSEFEKCLVIKKDNKIIGFITYVIIYERSEINDIIIDKEYRKKGYGNILLDEALNDMLKNDSYSVTLEVNTKNDNAISFYKKNGFEIVSIRPKYYNLEDGYLMKKELR